MRTGVSGPPRKLMVALVLVAIAAGVALGYWVFLTLT